MTAMVGDDVELPTVTETGNSAGELVTPDIETVIHALNVPTVFIAAALDSVALFVPDNVNK